MGITTDVNEDWVEGLGSIIGGGPAGVTVSSGAVVFRANGKAPAGIRALNAVTVTVARSPYA